MDISKRKNIYICNNPNFISKAQENLESLQVN